MRPLTLLLILAAVACMAPGTAFAQQYHGHSDNPNGPTVSPYLNLLQNNNGANIGNYQTLVKPLIDQGNAINRQGKGLSALQQQVNSAPSAGAGADVRPAMRRTSRTIRTTSRWDAGISSRWDAGTGRSLWRRYFFGRHLGNPCLPPRDPLVALDSTHMIPAVPLAQVSS